jgi:serine protease inhibitor
MMRRSIRTISLFAVMFAACNDPVKPGEDGPWQAVQLDDRFVEGYTDFGFALFRAAARESPEENVFVSPTSAAFALAMTYNGAREETAEAMARVLGVHDLGRDAVNENNLRWLESLAVTGNAVEFALANSLWIRSGFPVETAFIERNRSFYRASVEELDFGSPAAVPTINAWVSEHTRGRIPTIVDVIPGNVQLYLINALFFRADWAEPFDRRRTSEAEFHRPDGSRTAVPMMRDDRSARVAFADGFSAVELPYGNGRFSMILMLPDEGRGLAEVAETLDAERWSALVDSFREQRVALEVPRMKLDWESSLNRALIGMGMGLAFGDGPHDFTAISPANPWIGEVRQKTHLEVDEEGTTAAAATSVAMPTSMPPALRFDRPFLLAIHDHATRTVLFLGQITDPI